MTWHELFATSQTTYLTNQKRQRYIDMYVGNTATRYGVLVIRNQGQ